MSNYLLSNQFEQDSGRSIITVQRTNEETQVDSLWEVKVGPDYLRAIMVPQMPTELISTGCIEYAKDFGWRINHGGFTLTFKDGVLAVDGNVIFQPPVIQEL